MKLLIAAALLAVAIRDFYNFRRSKDHFLLDYIMAGLDPVFVIFAVYLLLSAIPQVQIPL